MQVIKYGQYAYVAHVGKSKMALSILDVSDPSNPRLLRQIPRPPNTHTMCGDTPVVVPRKRGECKTRPYIWIPARISYRRLDRNDV